MKKRERILGIKKDILYPILAIIGIAVLLYTYIGLSSGTIGSKECPSEIKGTLASDFIIKYFDSPFCVYCWLQKPINKRMIEKHGDKFRFETYDIRYCYREANKYGITGVPSFVFSIENATKEYPHYGFIPEDKLESVICELSGGC